MALNYAECRTPVRRVLVRPGGRGRQKDSIPLYVYKVAPEELLARYKGNVELWPPSSTYLFNRSLRLLENSGLTDKSIQRQLNKGIESLDLEDGATAILVKEKKSA